MSDEQRDLTVDQDGDSDLIRDLRKQLRTKNSTIKTATEELTRLRETVRETVFDKVGIPKGMRALVVKGVADVEDFDWTEDSVKKFAEEYEIPLSAADGAGGEQPPAGSEDDLAEQRRQAQERRQNLAGGGTPPPAGSPSLDERIKAAEQAGDRETATLLKQEKVARFARTEGIAS
jgi:hypothetical protein